MMGSLQSELEKVQKTKTDAPEVPITRARLAGNMQSVYDVIELCDGVHAAAAEKLGLSASGFGTMIARQKCSMTVDMCARMVVKDMQRSRAPTNKSLYVVTVPAKHKDALEGVFKAFSNVSFMEMDL